MKLAIVGGGAASTPALFVTPEIQAMAGDLDAVLIGRSPEHLDAVRRAISLVASDGVRVQCATEVSAARDASVVVVQVRYGGYAARARDETFPLAFDACGDEGLGAGGLSAAYRSWPPLRETLRKISAIASDATVLLMTAPLGILVRCAQQEFPQLRLYGLCELPLVTLRTVCSAASVSLEACRFNYAGVNHLGWFDDIRDPQERDVIARFADSRRDKDAFPSAALIRECEAVPLSYFRLHYFPRESVSEQRSRPPRAVQLAALQERTYANFLCGDSEAIAESLAQRPTPWYTHAVAPMIAGLSGHPSSSNLFFLSTRNDGYLPEFIGDDVIEQPFAIQDGKLLRRERTRPLPASLSTVLTQLVRYEAIAARAVSEERIEDSACVLAEHPWLRGSPFLAELAAGVASAAYATDCANAASR
jgi:6-phospho-beta-glucosidase